MSKSLNAKYARNYRLRKRLREKKVKKIPLTSAERTRRYRQKKQEAALLASEIANLSSIQYNYGNTIGFEKSEPEEELKESSFGTNASWSFPFDSDYSSLINGINTTEFITEQPESYCRFCCSTDNLLSIFPCAGIPNERLIRLLRELIDINLTVALDFPSAICVECVSKLENFYIFRQKCRAYNLEISRRRIQQEQHSANVKNEILPESEEKSTMLIAVKEELIIEDATHDVSNNNNAALKKSTIVEGKSSSMYNVKQEQTLSEISKQRDYRCKLCGMFYTDKESINLHMKKHIDTENLRCRNCFKTSESVHGLMMHAVLSYILKSFPCQYCDIHFPTKDELFVHEIKCENSGTKNKTESVSELSKPAKCSVCPKSFETLHSLQAHMQLHETKFQCKSCGVDLPSAALLRHHYDRYHAQGAKLIASTVKCDPCQRTFIDASAFRSHHTRFHENQSNDTSRKLDEEKLYECDHCGKRFWSINTIRYHVLVHRKYRNCDQCADSFRSVKELRCHKLKSHPVYCAFCSQEFSSEKARRSHCNKKHGMVHVRQLVNDGGKSRITYKWRTLSFRCALCDQQYSLFRQLKDHYGKMHSGAKLLIRCTHCNRDSTSRIGYIGHLTGNCGQTPKRLR